MLVLESIRKELGGRTLLDGVSFAANRGEAIGIVGPNGSGKSTLLRIVAGDLDADAGRVELPPGARLARLPQGYADASATVAATFPALFPETLDTQLAALSQRIGEATDPGETERLSVEFDALLARISAGWSSGELAEAFAELGLRSFAPDTPVGQLSGGELTKLGLINLFAANPDVLLLDEPTNHLDLRGVDWLEERIAAFPGPVLIVSHDRALLDDCVDAIVELDAATGRAEVYVGGYTEYADEKARRQADQWERFRRQQEEEKRLKRTISAIESRSRSIENSTINFYVRKRAKKVARRAVTLRARVERQLESVDHVERPDKPVHGLQGKFIATAERGPAILLSANAVSLAAGRLQLASDINFDIRRGERVAIVGPNGCGKTTLLRAILGETLVAAGRLDVAGSASVGYLAQEDDEQVSGSEASLTAVELLRRDRVMSEAEAFNYLHRFLFGHDRLGTRLGAMSYGERRRLALARLILRGTNLLLLDEPTNHLDLPSKEAFEAAFASYEGAALVVTHDRYFIARFATRVLAFEGGRVTEV
ncbi:hypothetical protein AYO38_06860 [bacterium SCGC AG-212-C10]|nr:hypothetical protein AYO38_06860 [bacterium SCGC AG-212-C10]